MTLRDMAVSYRRGAEMIRLRIALLRGEQEIAGRTEWLLLERRIRELTVLYRESRETAKLLEGYYRREDEEHDA